MNRQSFLFMLLTPFIGFFKNNTALREQPIHIVFDYAVKRYSCTLTYDDIQQMLIEHESSPEKEICLII
jgi:hypothetical protein